LGQPPATKKTNAQEKKEAVGRKAAKETDKAQAPDTRTEKKWRQPAQTVLSERAFHAVFFCPRMQPSSYSK